MATLDSLTGLPVRRAFLKEFEREAAAAKRYAYPFSVAILDLDHFKRINDTYGHQTGELVLKRFSELLRTRLRYSDFPARWGGEEFAILFPGTDAEGSATILNKLGQDIAAEVFPPPAEVLRVTVSAGIAQCDGTGMSAEDTSPSRTRRCMRRNRRAGTVSV